MKLIIEIPDRIYKINQNRTLNITDAGILEKAVRNGTPLDDVKAEIKSWYWQVEKQSLAKDPCVVDAMVDLFIRTIDNIGKESEE